jgi:hypothetical protein
MRRHSEGPKRLTYAPSVRKWLGSDAHLIAVGVLLVLSLASIAVRATAQAEWAGALLCSVLCACVIASLFFRARLRQLAHGPSGRRWLGRADRVLAIGRVVLVLGAISSTIGGIKALAHTEWGLALQFLLTATLLLLSALLPIRAETEGGGGSGREASATTAADDQSGGRVVVLQFGRSRLKVARAIHRLRAEANLPIALVDYGALPFVAGERLPDDVATLWVDELSAVGAVARVE